MDFFCSTTNCPIGNGGGTCKTIEDVEKFVRTGIWAVEIGSITELARPGNEGNIFFAGSGYTLNSLGLPNPGRKYYEAHLPAMIAMIHKAGKIAIVNVVGFSKEEYAELTSLAFICGADLVVLNAGCPNVWVDGQQKGILTYDYTFDSLRKVVTYTLSKNLSEAADGRIGLKLSPIFDPFHIKNMADFLDGYVLRSSPGKRIPYVGFIATQNTIPNCYNENNEGDAVISPAKGLSGMAGNAILPMALGQVRQFRELLDPKIKIIGVGGITSGKDMEKMINCGADCVQVVSAYYRTEDVSVFNHIGGEYLGLREMKVNRIE